MAAPTPDDDRKVSIRPISEADESLLFRIYASTREEELKSWGWSPEKQDHFLRMQYDARRRSYDAMYPGAAESIVLSPDGPAGSITIFRSPSEIRLVDIALLPEYRGRGIGTAMISMLIREAGGQNVPLRLSVFRGNRAIRLYQRLGFLLRSADVMYAELERPPYVQEFQ